MKLDDTWAIKTFDPWDTRLNHSTVWDVYKTMRAAGAAVKSEAHGGFWSITRYDDIRAAGLDPTTFSSAKGGIYIGRRNETPSVPLELDRPEHTRYRRAMQAPFLPNRLEHFHGLIRGHVVELLEAVAAMEEFDIVRDVAEPLPVRVISDLLGIPAGERRHRHRELAMAVVHSDLSSMGDAYRHYEEFLRDEVRGRRHSPGEDFITELWSMEPEGGPFDESELTVMVRALALAGHHTTVNAISSLLIHMSDEEVRRRYRDEPVPEQAVEEVLRLDPPVHLEARTTTSSVVIGDEEIPAGANVALVYASGNRDERRYDDPDRFDPWRERSPHLSFGHGLHKCLGAPLARLEMGVILDEMIDRFPAYRITDDPVDSGMVIGHHMGWESIPAVVR